MIKFIQWTLAIIGIVALAVVGVGFFLPSKFEVQRSVVIQAPPGKVYDLVSDPRTWAKWSVWNQRDPNMHVTYSGPPFGQGAKWAWVSASEGSGSMEFVKVDPNRRIDYTLSFPEFGMKSAGEWQFEPQGTGTKVTWSNRGDVGANPLKHYLSWMMDRMVGPDFEAGLANLKKLAEAP
jgi:uncharacterized protein YndB with AHSA1/START domain